MSKAEIEKFATLLNEWSAAPTEASQDALVTFLRLYRQPLVSALRLYAADK